MKGKALSKKVSRIYCDIEPESEPLKLSEMILYIALGMTTSIMVYVGYRLLTMDKDQTVTENQVIESIDEPAISDNDTEMEQNLESTDSTDHDHGVTQSETVNEQPDVNKTQNPIHEFEPKWHRDASKVIQTWCQHFETTVKTKKGMQLCNTMNILRRYYAARRSDQAKKEIQRLDNMAQKFHRLSDETQAGRAQWAFAEALIMQQLSTIESPHYIFVLRGLWYQLGPSLVVHKALLDKVRAFEAALESKSDVVLNKRYMSECAKNRDNAKKLRMLTYDKFNYTADNMVAWMNLLVMLRGYYTVAGIDLSENHMARSDSDINRIQASKKIKGIINQLIELVKNKKKSDRHIQLNTKKIIDLIPERLGTDLQALIFIRATILPKCTLPDLFSSKFQGHVKQYKRLRQFDR